VTPRPLAEVVTDALLAGCDKCFPASCQPCDCQPGGVHVARLAKAHRLRLIGDTDLMSVLGQLGVFTPATVVTADAEVPSWT